MAANKVAVVTGSNKGIGFAIVKGLCEKFAGIVYLTARDESRGKAAVAELNKLGFSPLFHQLDITDSESVKKFADHIKEKHGGIDVLVNNAAIAFKAAATEPFSEQAKTTLHVNYFSLVEACDILFPLLLPGARVVNVSSSAGHLSRVPSEELRAKLSDPTLTVSQLNDLMNEFVDSAQDGSNKEKGWGTSAYAISKVGVSALTRIQQRIFSSDNSRPGIIVNSVHPGYVDTDMTSHKGHLTIEQGAEAPLFLALFPENEKELKGEYIWFDKKVIDWASENSPGAF